jgi:hypothetical protein
MQNIIVYIDADALQHCSLLDATGQTEARCWILVGSRQVTHRDKQWMRAPLTIGDVNGRRKVCFHKSVE